MRQHLARTLAVFGALSAGYLGAGGDAHAQTISSDKAAGLVVFPRIVSDPDDIFTTGVSTDTVVQLTNTDSTTAHVVHCFYVNATGRCSSGSNVPGTAGAECRSALDCLGVRPTCDPQWSPNNFNLVLSPNQTVGLVASQNLVVPAPGDGSAPAVSGDYFEGELKCIEVDDDDVISSDVNPIAANDIQGNATIYTYSEGVSLDVRSYNGIGVQAVGNNDAEGDKILCLGGNGIDNDACEVAEYAACPSRLILDHWFDGATYTDGGNVTGTSVTFAPCSEDFSTLETPRIVVQVLVFNEFEQRFSASTEVDCVTTIDLSEISNVYDVGVQGTLTGQTSFRPVASGSSGVGVGLLAVAEETISRQGAANATTAFHLNQAGSTEGVADVVNFVVP